MEIGGKQQTMKLKIDNHVCKSCGRSDVEFYADRRNRFGHKPVCIECYNKGRKPTQADRRLSKQKRDANKQFFIDLAGGCCQRCGYNEFIAGLTFHHVDPKTKDYHPSKISTYDNREKAYVELDKCVLLCVNCHFAYHAGSWKATFIKRFSFGWMIDENEIGAC